MIYPQEPSTCLSVAPGPEPLLKMLKSEVIIQKKKIMGVTETAPRPKVMYKKAILISQMTEEIQFNQKNLTIASSEYKLQLPSIQIPWNL